MCFDPCDFLPATFGMSLTTVAGLAAVCFLCIIGLAISADETRKEARLKARFQAWPRGTKRPVEPGEGVSGSGESIPTCDQA